MTTKPAFKLPRLNAQRRDRCPLIGKLKFTQQEARRAAQNLARKGEDPVVYRCFTCHMYHLSSTPDSRTRTREANRSKPRLRYQSHDVVEEAEEVVQEAYHCTCLEGVMHLQLNKGVLTCECGEVYELDSVALRIHLIEDHRIPPSKAAHAVAALSSSYATYRTIVV